jgi:4-oxalocrotonate tautomerase
MPVIRIEMFPGRTADQKRAMAKAVTESFVATAGGTLQSVHIIIDEVARQDWSVGGTLCSELPAAPAPAASK